MLPGASPVPAARAARHAARLPLGGSALGARAQREAVGQGRRKGRFREARRAALPAAGLARRMSFRFWSPPAARLSVFKLSARLRLSAHSIFTCLNDVKWRYGFILCKGMYSMFPTLYWTDFFPHCIFLAPLVRITWLYRQPLGCSGSQFFNLTMKGKAYIHSVENVLWILIFCQG